MGLSICVTGQYTPAPAATPPALANKGMWTPDQLRPLLECAVLPIRSVELLHQIEHAGEHSWATAPTFALLQAGIADTASPPPLTPLSHTPYLTKGQAAPSPAGTLFAMTAFTPASALYRSQDKPTPTGAEQSPASLLPSRPGSLSASPSPPPKSNRLPQTPRLRSRQPWLSGRPLPAPPRWGSPSSRTWT